MRKTLHFYPVFIAAWLLLSACERTHVCIEPASPAFPQSYRGLLPTDSGAVLSFTDGIRILPFTTTVSKADTAIPERRYTTTELSPCGLPPIRMAQAHWEAESSSSAVHPGIRFWYSASYYRDSTQDQHSDYDEDVRLWWTPKGPADEPNAYFRYHPVLGNPAHGDSVALNLRLGTRSYDRVVALTADTMRSGAPQVWRVYFANPGGIVGFESRYTRSLFWQL